MPHLRNLCHRLGQGKKGDFVSLLSSALSFTGSLLLSVNGSSPNPSPDANDGSYVIWAFANICYAGMRAQNNPSTGWRILCFIFGFPGTLLSYFVVKEGSERVYGIDIPARHSDSRAETGSDPA